MEPQDPLDQLMISPLPSSPDGKGRRFGFLSVALVIVVGVAIAVAVLTDGEAPADPLAEPTSSVAPVAVTTTAVSQMVLADYQPEPALLYHPTVLPLGWEKCRQLEDSDRGDRFCDPDQEDVWIQVAVRDATPVRLANAVPISDAYGAMWLSQVDPVEIVVPSGAFSLLVALGNGLGGEDLLTVVESIPLVSNRDSLYGSYELPLAMADLSEEQLAGLVTAVDDDPRVVGQGDPQGDVQVYADEVVLRAFPNEDGGTLLDLATTISLPRLLVADRPVVVGERPSRGRTFAIWDQRGFSWRLEGQMPLTQLETLALDVIEKIAALDVE